MNAPQNNGPAAFARGTSEERNYWLDKLSQKPPISSLPARYSGAEAGEQRPRTVEIVLAGELHKKLDKLTAGKPFLLYAALMAVLKVCLYKYTGNNCIVVGSPARRLANDAVEQANALAIVDQMDGLLPFKQLLLNVRQTLLDAYARQGYSFSLLLLDLGIASFERRCPLFDVTLALEELHTDLPAVGNSINIRFAKEAERVTGIVSFDGGVHDRATVEGFGSHFVKVLQSALDNPDQPISSIRMIDDAELARLQLLWQGEKKNYKDFPSVHELFEAQAARTPDAAALAFENETVSYAELNRRSNQLAHYLRAHGVGLESRVAVLMERTANLIVSIFAIMKAGGTYLLLDPAYPHQRLKYMLEDARVRMVLSETPVPQLPLEHDVQVLNLDREWNEIERESVARVESGVRGEDLAYVLYTSGSTGQPKGVLVTHSALANFTLAVCHHFRLDSSDRLLLFLSPSFDAFGEELYPTLCSGATLVMHPYPIELPLGELLDFYVRLGVTSLHQAVAYTAFMAEELAHSGRRLPQQIKLLIVGGESITTETVRRFREVGGERVRILHVYGPSETTVTTTIWEVGEGEEAGRTAIGLPLWNVQIYVVDQDEELVPMGVLGELYIGGAGMARGYEGEAYLTAERFVPDRWSGLAGGRVYRTGDLVRYRMGGELVFVGRRDEQVKLHGRRIELGEIEVALRKIAGVRYAAVLLREDVPHEKRLVAYLLPERVSDESSDVSVIDIGAVREFLKQDLPDYMVPSAYVLVEKWPMTENGRLDRRALPPPDDLRADLSRSYVAPSGPMEEPLADIWKELLKNERIGIHDDFLESGGNSLMAFQLVSRIRDVFHVDLPLSSVFETPTIAEQATAIAHRMIQHEPATEIEAVLTQIEHLDDEELERLLETNRRK